ASANVAAGPHRCQPTLPAASLAGRAKTGGRPSWPARCMPPRRMTLPDGIVAVVKRDCPTCTLVAPVLADLAARGVTLTVYSQDDPSFPDGASGVVDDRELEMSW